MDEKCFSEGTDGKKSLRVHLINPPIDEPWRTKQDYLDDRKSMQEMEKRSAEAHFLLRKSFRNQTIALLIATLAMVGTLLGTVVAVSNYLDSERSGVVTETKEK